MSNSIAITEKYPAESSTQKMATTKKRTVIDAELEAEIEDPETPNDDYISLTTHADQFGSNPVSMDWGNPDPWKRGPVVATVKHGGQRNAIGAHGGIIPEFLLFTKEMSWYSKYDIYLLSFLSLSIW